MRCTALLVGALPEPLAVTPHLPADLQVDYERRAWADCAGDAIERACAQLMVVGAVDSPERAATLFESWRGQPPTIPTIAVLPGDTDPSLLRAAVASVDDFVLWPIRVDEWHQRVRRVLGMQSEEQDDDAIAARLFDEMGMARLIGEDRAFVAVVRKLPLMAATSYPVLICGETGTGKELCARAIHHLSQRRPQPFIAVDSAAAPEHLFENELFGHARGAFTDAHSDQKGLVAMAEGGTLFIDEVDSLSLASQAKLLRFLQEKSYRPLGANRFTPANVRILAASNGDLPALVRSGRFRSDLYFRLNVLRIELMPLRARRGDIEPLARHFVKACCAEQHTPRKGLGRAALQKLQAHDWPGNVRELLNTIQRAVVFAEGREILPCHLAVETPGTAQASATFREARAAALEEFERRYVADILRRHDGNVTQAARAAHKERRAFGRLVKRHHLGRSPD
jgi:DNA-binding NtrC family response regulator